MMTNEALTQILAGGVTGAILAGLVGGMIVIDIALWILRIIGNWKIFTKAGQPGWKAIIPFYNTYIEYKISWKTSMFWIVLALSVLSSVIESLGGSDPSTAVLLVSLVPAIAAAVIACVALYKLAVAFGHGIGYTIGLILLEPIFRIILGFGKSEYQGNSSAKQL